MPARIFMNVDLPAPFSPTTANTSPALKRKETLSNACTPGKCLRTSRTSSKDAIVAHRPWTDFAESVPPGFRMLMAQVCRGLGSASGVN